jgi:hypothetical protein
MRKTFGKGARSLGLTAGLIALVWALIAARDVSLDQSTSFVARSSLPGQPGSRPTETTANPLIDELNHCIQARFLHKEGIGMARIADFSNHMGRFVPETPEEHSAIRSLTDARIRVGFYLAGRSVLGLQPADAAAESPSALAGVRRPVSITERELPAELPKPSDLLAIAKTGLLMSKTHDRYAIGLGDWTVDVRPVRASKPMCLECHLVTDSLKDGAASDQLRLGDALGVAIYVYAPRDVPPHMDQHRGRSESRPERQPARAE